MTYEQIPTNQELIERMVESFAACLAGVATVSDMFPDSPDDLAGVREPRHPLPVGPGIAKLVLIKGGKS